MSRSYSRKASRTRGESSPPRLTAAPPCGLLSSGNMIEEHLFRVGIALAIAAMCGCGSSVQDTSSSGGGGGTGGSGEAPATGIGGGAILAIHSLWLGDTTPDGAPSKDAWRGYGFDLDGKPSTAQSTDLCQPLKDASAESVYPDGDDGIDNNFGHHVVPIMLGLTPTLSADASASIDEGEAPTTLFRLGSLGTPDGTAEALPCDHDGQSPPPAWDGSDTWRARSDGLEGADPASPRARFTESEVVRTSSGLLVWRARGADGLRLLITVSGFVLPIPLRAVRVTATLSEDLTHLTEGRLGGVVDLKLFVHELSMLGADVLENGCPSPTSFEPLATSIYQAADILADGAQDPALPCDGISIGLGFEADAAGIEGTVEIAPDPCPL